MHFAGCKFYKLQCVSDVNLSAILRVIKRHDAYIASETAMYILALVTGVNVPTILRVSDRQAAVIASKRSLIESVN